MTTPEKRQYDESAKQLIDHALACRDGCRMHAWWCPVGQALVEAENAAWVAYRRAAQRV